MTSRIGKAKHHGRRAGSIPGHNGNMGRTRGDGGSEVGLKAQYALSLHLTGKDVGQDLGESRATLGLPGQTVETEIVLLPLRRSAGAMALLDPAVAVAREVQRQIPSHGRQRFAHTDSLAGSGQVSSAFEDDLAAQGQQPLRRGGRCGQCIGLTQQGDAGVAQIALATSSLWTAAPVYWATWGCPRRPRPYAD